MRPPRLGFDVAAQTFGDPTAKEREPLKKPAVLVDISSIGEGDKVVIDDKEEEEEDLNHEGLEAKEHDEEHLHKGKERQHMHFDEIAKAVAPMLDKLFPPSASVRIIVAPGRYLVTTAVTLFASIVSVCANCTSDVVPTQAISDSGASGNVFRVTRAKEDKIVQGQARVLEREEAPSSSPPWRG